MGPSLACWRMSFENSREKHDTQPRQIPHARAAHSHDGRKNNGLVLALAGAATSWRRPMVCMKLVPIGLAAAFVCSTGLASAAPFKCPSVGGEFVFGQEANINSLDQMASSTISTRNIAMNIFETLMTRDENNNPITGTRRIIRGVAGPADLHVQAPPGREIPQRQADDLGGRGRLVRPLQQGRASSAACSRMSPAGTHRMRRPSSSA